MVHNAKSERRTHCSRALSSPPVLQLHQSPPGASCEANPDYEHRRRSQCTRKDVPFLISPLAICSSLDQCDSHFCEPALDREVERRVAGAVLDRANR